MVDGGYAARFASTQDIAPNTQTGFELASAKYLSENKPAVMAFLRACLRAQADILKGGPRAFPPDVQKTLASWQKRPLEEVAKLAPPYFEIGPIRTDSISIPEQYWSAQGLLKNTVDAAKLIDNSFITAVRMKR